MSKGPVEEFTLDGAGSPDGDSSAGHGSSGHGPSGPDRRRRSSPGWRHSPGLWVALATVLVVVGAAVSPQGDPLEPHPPDTAWTAAAPTPGRAPGLWVLADQPVIAGADGLTALDPTTGDPAWTVPLEDPACTATAEALTCVHGEGQSASIATIDPAGDVTEQPFPHADVALSAGDDVIVAGGTAAEGRWLGRFTVDSPPEPIWQYQPEHSAERRWQQVVLSQGIVTVSTGPENAEGEGPPRWTAFSLAADVETGEPRPAVMHMPNGTAVGTGPDVTDRWNQTVLPMPGPEPTIPGYPDAVFTGRGVFDSYGGDRILEYLGGPLVAVGDDIIVAGPHPELTAIPEPGADVEVMMRTERVDVRTGEAQWQLDRDQLLDCPCAISGDTIVLTASVLTEVERFTTSPVALLGLDPDSGRHHWTLPISTRPDAIAAGGDHVYVLTGGTLAAYENE